MKRYLKNIGLKNINKNRYDIWIYIDVIFMEVLCLISFVLSFFNLKKCIYISSSICLVALIIFIVLIRFAEADNAKSRAERRKIRNDVLKQVLDETGIQTTEQIRGLMNLYQGYVNKCHEDDKVYMAIIEIIVAVVGGFLTFAFNNMSELELDMNAWIYLVEFIVFVAVVVCIILFSFKFFDTTRWKYEMMIEHLQELLISNSNDVILPAMPDAATENKCLEQPYIKTVEYSANLKYEEALKRI
jgi:ABC-type transport system involved in cytochrome bd biosynthesis fused ATPase/permease subunit